MNASGDQRAARLERFLRRWTNAHPRWQYAPAASPYPRLREAHAVARDMLADAEFAEVHLADWFQSPDGQLVRSVARAVLPFAPSIELELLVEAVTLAADAHRREREGLAAVASLAALAVILVALGRLFPGTAGNRPRRGR